MRWDLHGAPQWMGFAGGLRWAYRNLRRPLLYHSITLCSHCPRGESKRPMIISGGGLRVCGTLFSIIQSPCTRFVRARGRTNRLMLAVEVFGGGWGRFGIGSVLRGAIVDGVCGGVPGSADIYSTIQSLCTRFVRAWGRTNRLMLAAGVFGGG